MLEFLIRIQGWIQGSLSAAMSGFAASRDSTLLAAMLPMGVAFGAIHALTPGHGKTVLASYLVGSRLAGLKSLLVAGTLALTHVGSAVVIALLALPLISRSLGSVGRAPSLELLSRGLLAIIGFWLLIRALRGNRSHAHDESKGIMVGVVAGLVPCPLTLFAMVLALSRGVPEAGLTFALAMVLGVGLTLGAVALATVLARDWVVLVSARHGASIAWLARILDGMAGALLLATGLYALAGPALFWPSGPFRAR
jgi:nickel/cobalt transporter (NicO) family protein